MVSPAIFALAAQSMSGLDVPLVALSLNDGRPAAASAGERRSP